MTVLVVLAGCSSGDGGSPQTSEAAKPGVAGTVLDGTYRFDFDVAKRTQLGAPAPQPEPVSAKWAIRSHCADTGCVGTATRLNPDGSAAGTRTTLDFLDGKWVMVFAEDSRCNAGGQPTRVVGAWVLEPRPDGGLTGTWTEITTGLDCPWVVQMPVRLTRDGDVADNIPVADPANVEPRKPSKPEAFHGTYTQTITARPPDNQPGIVTIDVATFCVRNTDECASTQAATIEGKPQLTPLTFAGDKWIYRWDRSGRTCPGGAPSTGTGYDEVFFPAQASNPLPKLTGSRRLDVGEPCPTQRSFDLLYERNNAPAPPAPAPAPGG